MNKDKKMLYTISLLILALLLSALFTDLGNSKIVSACLLAVMCVVTRILIKKRNSHSVNKKEVLLLLTVVGVIYVVLIELSGVVLGFYKNPYFVNTKLLVTTIIPILVMIIATEIIRSTLLDQKNKTVNVLAFLLCLISEVLIFSNISGITSFNLFMDLIGLTLFPAISANIFYHYVSKRFGAVPNISFRIITTLYPYFMKSTSALSDAMLSCVKIIVPLLLLALVSGLYEKKKKNAIQKGQKLSLAAVMLSAAVILSIAMLISCQFRFGAIVIATESMTGEINKGDMIVYERYEDQTIEEGQVIVFLQDQNRIVHRVVKIERIGSEVRYITKGDANETEDIGYITDQDIIGLTDIKVSYIGYPTLWLRELLESSN